MEGLASAGVNLLGGVIEGGQNADIANVNAQNSLMNTYAQGPRKEVLPYLDANMRNLVSGYNDPNRQYIGAPSTNEAYQRAIAMGLDPSLFNTAMTNAQAGYGNIQSAGTGVQNYLNSGAQNVTGSQIADYTRSLLDPRLINSQVDAYGRDIARNLNENVLTGIRSDAVGSGNLGSSREAIGEAVATRGAADRLADFRGGLVGNAMTQAQNQLQSNVGNTMGGYNALSNLGAQQIGGASNLLNLSQDQLAQLSQVGKLQAGINQADVANQIGQRDFGLTNQAQLNQLLLANANAGNLVDPNSAAKVNGGTGFGKIRDDLMTVGTLGLNKLF